MQSRSLPSATYRLQFNSLFTLKQATDWVSYFSSLGVSHLYASPLFKARKGSTHGYDITDYSTINPEIGTLEEFSSFVKELKKFHMGLILDIVPNHMGIGPENGWWQDVLENGPSSKYASYFDIDWHSSKHAFENKIFLPILEHPFGIALEDKLIQIFYKNGLFFIKYKEIILPTTIESGKSLLTSIYQEVSKLYSEKDPKTSGLRVILESYENIERDREEEKRLQSLIIKKQINFFFKEFIDVYDLLNKQLDVLNGIKNNPESFNNLEKFLEIQHYRLCYWKVANDEINYRRFFDIYEYAAIRIEISKVFKDVTVKIMEFLQEQWVEGLRIDHIDGLWDPQEFLENLRQDSSKPISFLIVEKILTGNETLRAEWPIEGSVGYDYLNQLNGLFVFQNNKSKILEIYQNFTGLKENTQQIKYECKKLLLNTTLASELNFLTRQLNSIAVHHRLSQDFTWENLKTGLTEVIACFPVYRSYIRAQLEKVHEEDNTYIEVAIEKAKRYNPHIDHSTYEFIKDVLLLEFQKALDETHKEAANRFVMHFQQITGPVMAKGLEDTAFYRYYPLSSLNEVGGDFGIFGLSLKNFHKKNLERFKNFPHSLLSSSTHDTKRSEDVRARINVISEIPEVWAKALYSWNLINHKNKLQKDEGFIPDRNEEYLIYQTLIGTWPYEGLNLENHPSYLEKIEIFLEKAVKEAKIHSSWIETNESYHSAVKEFLRKILDLKDNPFIESFNDFIVKIRDAALLNSLSQLILKLTCPGIPDIYQGNELLTYSLVDPDNRRPIDFKIRQSMLEEISSIEDYLHSPQDGRLKLWITKKTLCLRHQNFQLFSEGAYLELIVEGPLMENVIAFARFFSNKVVIVITCRFFTQIIDNLTSYKNNFDGWEDFTLMHPPELSNKKYLDIYTGNTVLLESTQTSLIKIFSQFPFVVLESQGVLA